MKKPFEIPSRLFQRYRLLKISKIVFENTSKYSQVIQTKENLADNQKYQAESRPLYNKILTHFRYSCFETDPVWGYLSTAFIFISGIAWSFMIAYNLQRKKGLKDIHFWIIVLLTPLSSSIFPVMMISMKLMAVFNNGKELKKLCDTFTYAEGQVEAFAQTGLQLYIIFKRSDR